MRRFARVPTTRSPSSPESFGQEPNAGPTGERTTASGFSLIELLIVVAIGVVLAAMAVPMTINAMRTYRLTAAVAAATGAIQSTRYAAIMHGYPYEITFTPATGSYQIYNQPSGSSWTAVGSAIPIAKPGDVIISRSVTYQFFAGGTVTETSVPINMSFQIGDSFGGSNTITVSGVGNVTVSTP